MRRLSCFIKVSLKCNHIHSFKCQAEGYIAQIKEKITVTSETEMVLIHLQSKKCQQPSEAGRSKKQILSQSFQREHSPGSNTLFSTQWILVLYIWTPKLRKNTFLLFQTIQFVVTCYSSRKKSIQSIASLLLCPRIPNIMTYSRRNYSQQYFFRKHSYLLRNFQENNLKGGDQLSFQGDQAGLVCAT